MISFIIPTLNEEKTIEKTLKNLSEYFGEKEIIVSDGRSSDKTIEIAKKYTDKVIIHDEKIIYFYHNYCNPRWRTNNFWK